MQLWRDALPCPARRRTVATRPHRCSAATRGRRPPRRISRHAEPPMRDPAVACLRAMRLMLLLAALACLGACDGRLAVPPSPRGAWQQMPPLPGPVDAAAAAICAAPHATVLVPAPAAPGDSARDVRVHYNRPDGAYADWGLHVWQVDADGRHL